MLGKNLKQWKSGIFNSNMKSASNLNKIVEIFTIFSKQNKNTEKNLVNFWHGTENGMTILKYAKIYNNIKVHKKTIINSKNKVRDCCKLHKETTIRKFRQLFAPSNLQSQQVEHRNDEKKNSQRKTKKNKKITVTIYVIPSKRADNNCDDQMKRIEMGTVAKQRGSTERSPKVQRLLPPRKQKKKIVLLAFKAQHAEKITKVEGHKKMDRAPWRRQPGTVRSSTK